MEPLLKEKNLRLRDNFSTGSQLKLKTRQRKNLQHLQNNIRPRIKKYPGVSTDPQLSHLQTFFSINFPTKEKASVCLTRMPDSYGENFLPGFSINIRGNNYGALSILLVSLSFGQPQLILAWRKPPKVSERGSLVLEAYWFDNAFIDLIDSNQLIEDLIEAKKEEISTSKELTFEKIVEFGLKALRREIQFKHEGSP
ncbi:MAG: hypothetical protein ACFFBD_04645 [Candidatus Hodarchaeota archaeon]